LNGWQSLRRQLTDQHYVRTLGRRFRQHPLAYLRALESLLGIKSNLPP
jgi:hypothetical protein